MILSDFDLDNAIKNRRIVIEPFEREIVRENGIDFRLADEIAHHSTDGNDFVMDPFDEKQIERSYVKETGRDKLVIRGHEQVLLSTYEYLEMPDDVVGFVELRSTWARHGLSMPPTIIDAGFKGTVTLEVINNAPYGIMLRPKQRFAHVIFVKTNSRVTNAYSGQYSGQKGIKLPKKVEG